MYLHKLVALAAVSVISVQLFFPTYAVVTAGGILGAAASMACVAAALLPIAAVALPTGLRLGAWLQI